MAPSMTNIVVSATAHANMSHMKHEAANAAPVSAAIIQQQPNEKKGNL
jgi:hypothetical protein